MAKLPFIVRYVIIKHLKSPSIVQLPSIASFTTYIILNKYYIIYLLYGKFRIGEDY